MLHHRIKQPHWHDASGVITCRDCDGEGSRPNRPWLNNGDPDCWPVDCAVCAGKGHHPCSVCGFDHDVPGYDCVICAMVRDMPSALLARIMPAEIGEAFAAAAKVALAAEVRS